jgi:hypothetical protein
MMKTLPLTIALLLNVGVFAAHAGQGQTTTQTTRSGIRVTIYPILVQAPIFGASIDLPSVPGDGGDGEAGDVSGTTDVTLDAAYMAGLKVEGDRWFAETQGTWAAISASRNAPRVVIDTDTVLFGARGGVRLFGGFSATAGVRHAAVSLDATLSLPNLNTTIHGHTEPGLWDPMLGVDWRARGNRWDIEANFQGGGFGVGTDVDLAGAVIASRHFGRHVDLRIGYEALYYKFTVADVNIGRFQRTLVSEQTLHGPSIGIGLVF